MGKMKMGRLKFMVSKLSSLELNSLSTHNHTTPTPFIFTFLSSFSSLSKTPNPLFANFLIHSFDFSRTRALTVANKSRFTNLKSLHKPQAVLTYFQNLGFSPQQIKSCVNSWPQILLSKVDKTLKPKIEYFQQLGLSASHLGKFISTSPSVLGLSLEKKLVPTVELFRKILVNDKENEDLLKIFNRNSRLLLLNINSKILPKVRFLESCGIVGSQLAQLFKVQPRLFSWNEVYVRNLVSRATSLGFNMNSRMFVHALFAISCVSEETFKRKVETLERFGFSKDELMEMFRKTPCLVRKSSNSLSMGLDFCLNTAKLKKEVIISYPPILTYSLEKRVIPRFRVLWIIMSKQLLKKEPSLSSFVFVREEVFLERFISKFSDHREELLKAYKGYSLDSFPEDEMSGG